MKRRLGACLALWLLCGAAVLAQPAREGPKALDSFQYTFMKTFLTDMVILTVTRDGKVSYSYQSDPATGSGGVTVGKKWEISRKDAVALLDGLVKDGLLKMKDADGKDKARGRHRVTVSFGGRELTIIPKELPKKVFARLLPLLQKAHPAKWKADLP